MSDQESCAVELKVDVGILKNQVVTLTQLCNKMDSVIRFLQSINEVLNYGTCRLKTS